MRYLSYPRSPSFQDSGIRDYYFSHEIHSAPDFDQVIHAQIDLDSCVCKGCESKEDYENMFQLINTGGVEWMFPLVQNELEDRLMPSSEILSAILLSVDMEIQSVGCNVVVLEEIHCVVGPAFANRC